MFQYIHMTYIMLDTYSFITEVSGPWINDNRIWRHYPISTHTADNRYPARTNINNKLPNIASRRDHSGYDFSQWETTLQCKVVSTQIITHRPQPVGKTMKYARNKLFKTLPGEMQP